MTAKRSLTREQCQGKPNQAGALTSAATPGRPSARGPTGARQQRPLIHGRADVTGSVLLLSAGVVRCGGRRGAAAAAGARWWLSGRRRMDTTTRARVLVD
jgi:hypothetical protein